MTQPSDDQGEQPDLKKRMEKLRKEHDKLLGSLSSLPPEEASKSLDSLEKSFALARQPAMQEIDESAPEDPAQIKELDIPEQLATPDADPPDIGPSDQSDPLPIPVEIFDQSADPVDRGTPTSSRVLSGSAELLRSPAIAPPSKPAKPPEVVPETAAQSHRPIPEPPMSPVSTGYDVDVDWTPGTAKGLDLTDSEVMVTANEMEPGPSLGLDDVAGSMSQFVVTLSGVLRSMQDILLEAVADIDDLRTRFDRVR